MDSILTNSLIRKYFGCDCNTFSCRNNAGDTNVSHTSLRVFRAMEERIKKGDRRLYVDGMGAVWDGVHPIDLNPDYHPEYLRLPDRFQEKKEFHQVTCKCGVEVRHEVGCDGTPPAPAETEECFCGGSDQAGHNPSIGHATHKPCDDLCNHPKPCPEKCEHGCDCGCVNLSSCDNPPSREDEVEKKQDKCGCGMACKNMGPCFCHCHKRLVDTPEDRVERAVRDIMYSVSQHGNIALETQLRSLVALVRNEAKGR